MDLSKREPALDIARVFALMTVVGVHFFLHNGYYQTELSGAVIYAITFIRSFCMVCVPLFLFLTGYLMNGKTLSKRYYKGLDKTLGIYLLASVTCYLIKRFYLEIPSLSLFSITDYTMCDYAWYVEMYIGLFLLIPFLNLSYHGLKSKKQKQALVLTLIAVSMLPAILNVYNFKESGFWAHPAAYPVTQKIFPAFFLQLYPIAYYFAGAYLKEFPVRLGKAENILLIFGSLLVYGGFSIWRSDGAGVFQQGVWQNWYSPLLFVMALFVFIFFTNLDTGKMKTGARSFLATLSDLSFGAYLMTCVFDKVAYRFLGEHFFGFYQKFAFYIPSVVFVVVMSLLSSYVLNFVFRRLKAGLSALINAVLKKKQQA